MEFGVGTVILGLFALAALKGPLERRIYDHLIRKCIAFDRICRLADIGMKDLSYEILQTYWIGKAGGLRGRYFRIQFVYQFNQSVHWVGGENGQGFDTLQSRYDGIEDEVAAAIMRVKEREAAAVA